MSLPRPSPAATGRIRGTSNGCLQSNLSRDGRGQAGGIINTSHTEAVPAGGTDARDWWRSRAGRVPQVTAAQRSMHTGWPPSSMHVPPFFTHSTHAPDVTHRFVTRSQLVRGDVQGGLHPVGGGAEVMKTSNATTSWPLASLTKKVHVPSSAVSGMAIVNTSVCGT